ncbi:MAG: hypothetical protein FWE80_03205 [Oscillospiraceae bacterium]|nr:hypothetical protein [Oscillospiraceae bacterium]
MNTLKDIGRMFLTNLATLPYALTVPVYIAFLFAQTTPGMEEDALGILGQDTIYYFGFFAFLAMLLFIMLRRLREPYLEMTKGTPYVPRERLMLHMRQVGYRHIAVYTGFWAAAVMLYGALGNHGLLLLFLGQVGLMRAFELPAVGALAGGAITWLIFVAGYCGLVLAVHKYWESKRGYG